MSVRTSVGRFLIAAFAGIVGSLAFAPIEAWPTMLVSLCMLIWVASTSERHALLLGFGYGLGFFLPLLHWSGTYVGAFPWVALATLQAAFIAPVALAVSRLHKRVPPWAFVVIVPAIWVLQEAIRSRVPWGGFGWGRVAFSQVDAPYVEVVTIAGAPLLSFMTVLVSTVIVALRGRALLIAGLVVIAGTMALLPLGPALITASRDQTTVRVAAVQGNVPRLGLDFNSQRKAVLDNHIRATQGIVPGSVDVVVWPENASDIDPLDDLEVRRSIDELVGHIGAPFVIGAVLRDDGQLLNASLFWSPERGAGERYIKRRLAPFGEFMPLRDIAERLVPAARRVVDFTPGKEVVLFQIPQARIGTMICFEVLYDDLGRDLVRSGATILLAQTNSATFGTSPESHQQLQMTRLRAVEHHRAIVSVSTSGISAIVNERGRILTQSDFFEARVLTGSITTQSGVSLSDRIGSAGEAALISLPLMIRLALALKSRRRRW